MAPITRKFGSMMSSQAERPEPDTPVQTADAERGRAEPATLVGPRPQQVRKVHKGPGPRAAGPVHTRPRDASITERPVQLHLSPTVTVQLVGEGPSRGPVAILHDRGRGVAEPVTGQLGTPAELDLGAAADKLLVPAAERPQDLH